MAGASRRWVDLHLHSNASDGRYPPAKVMELAAARGLTAVALTDHDTVDGLAEAKAAAESLHLEFIPGVELEASHGRKRLHILGYCFNPDSEAMRAALTTMIERRHERNRRIIARLAELGVEIHYEDVLARAVGAAVGRPHIAEELVSRRVVSGFQQAFSRYLGSEAAAYVSRETITAPEAIALIRDAGGVASIAHPGRIPTSSSLEFATIISALRDAGLAALEVSHPDHNDVQVRFLTDIANRYGLLPTGGSDFHSLRTTVTRGTGFTKRKVPYEWLEALRHAAGHDRVVLDH